MKNNVRTEWTPEKINAMVAARGACKGHIAILVSSEIGDDELEAGEFCSVIAVTETDRRDAITNLKAKLHPNIGIYAIMQSCNPDAIISMANKSTVISKPIFPPRMSHGMTFHYWFPDNALGDVRKWAWDLLAEQFPVTILDEWGENADA